MVKKCEICNQEFVAISSNHLYCDKCRFSRCIVCGNKILIKPKAKHFCKFCSKNCYHKYQKGRKIPKDIVKKIADSNRGRKTGGFVYCLQCKKKTYKYPSDLRFSRKFCSFKCFLRYVSENASPKRTNKGKDKKWKKDVYRYDNYTCWICGEKGGKLNAHHLKSWAKYPKLRYKISNGVTLCKFCHKTYTDFGI